MTLQPERLETSPGLTVAGISHQYRGNTFGIPAQWRQLAPQLEGLSARVGDQAYGIAYNFEEGGVFDYLCGVQISTGAGLPSHWRSLFLPEGQRYAVFRHDQHVSEIRHTCDAIFTHWFPTSGYRLSSAPFFELYGPEFDPSTGLGGLEIWVPLES